MKMKIGVEWQNRINKKAVSQSSNTETMIMLNAFVTTIPRYFKPAIIVNATQSGIITRV
jgi:hypothetical protein